MHDNDDFPKKIYGDNFCLEGLKMQPENFPDKHLKFENEIYVLYLFNTIISGNEGTILDASGQTAIVESFD